MGHLAECNRDAKVIHKLPGRKPKIFLGNARWRQDRVMAACAEDHGATAAGQDAVLGVSAHGAGEGHPPGVAADGGQARRLLREDQAAGYCCDQPPLLLSQTFAASKFCSVLMYTALCTYDACVMSCSGEVIG